MAFKTPSELMEALRSEPEKYLRVRTLKRLDGFISGYSDISGAHAGRLALAEFCAFLAHRIAGAPLAQSPFDPYGNNHHWSYYLRLEGGDDRSAFERFWKHWAEFAAGRKDVSFAESEWAEFRKGREDIRLVSAGAHTQVADSLFTLLAQIRERPALYLGRGTCERLWAFLAGHRQARLDGGSWDNQGIVYDNFDQWVMEGRAARLVLDWSQAQSCDWGDDEALDYFFHDWDSYIAELRVWARRREYRPHLAAIAGSGTADAEAREALASLWMDDHDPATVPEDLCEKATAASAEFCRELSFALPIEGEATFGVTQMLRAVLSDERLNGSFVRHCREALDVLARAQASEAPAG